MEKEKHIDDWFKEIAPDDMQLSIYKEARDVVDDYRYFNAHIERTKMSEKWSFRLALDTPGNINGFFLANIKKCEMDIFLHDVDSLLPLLKIVFCLRVLFRKAQDNNFSEDSIRRLLEFESILKWYFEIAIDDCTFAFFGSSYTISECDEAIAKMRTLKRDDTQKGE